APIGAPGELYVGGGGLARGYHGRPDLTADRFRPAGDGAPGARLTDPNGAPGARLYCTGDLVRLLADGPVEVLGRTDHPVKLRGVRIEPGEIETALRAHPAVREAVVMARRPPAAPDTAPGGSDDLRLTAWVVPAEPAPGARWQQLVRELRRELAARL